MKENYILILFLTFFLLSGHAGYMQEPGKSVFDVSSGKDRQWILSRNNYAALYNMLCNEAFTLLGKRKQRVEAIRSAPEWETYRKCLRDTIFGSLGRFSKTPLNPKITGMVKRKGLTVEKIVIESHPGFYVTGCLFLPEKREKPAPVVIFCSGHSADAFRNEVYQHSILNLAEKGFVVYAFDPIGQGERLQYVDPASGKSKVGGPTTEHSYAGAQTLLAGTSLSDYFIWDGVRVVDYLLTRPEIDPERIGITGRSGGGTQSAMIAAYDERIYASAPECYITSFRRLLQSIGPQDAEQNMYACIARGFDFPDYFHLRAPKPALIVTTTHDFFSIQGARETFAEAQKSYSLFGSPGNIRITEDMGTHESTRKNREAIYAFFQEHLRLRGESIDRQVVPFSREELTVTPTGQVVTSYHGETVFSLNRKYFKRIILSGDNLKKAVIETTGIKPDVELESAVYTGQFTSGKATVEKFFLENSRHNVALPMYVIKDENREASKVLVWLHPEGKEKILDDPRLTDLLERGYQVISADMPGTGELKDPGFRGDGFVKGVPFNYTFGLNLTGNTIPGIHAGALGLVVRFIDTDARFSGKGKQGLAMGSVCPSLLYFAASAPHFEKVALENCPGSMVDMLNTEYYDPELLYNMAPGSAKFFDFSDLTHLFPAGSCRFFKPVDPFNREKGEGAGNSDILTFLNGS
jgi:cephalosporin-C deacetylase-like acetyl esterase